MYDEAVMLSSPAGQPCSATSWHAFCAAGAVRSSGDTILMVAEPTDSVDRRRRFLRDVEGIDVIWEQTFKTSEL